MYKLLPNDMYTGKPANCVIDTTTNSFIPFDPENKDYVQYLAWLEEGNTPEPADEGTK